MGKDTGVNGEAFTDNDLDAWAAQAESPEGYNGGHIGPAQTGGPVGIGAQGASLHLPNGCCSSREVQ